MAAMALLIVQVLHMNGGVGGTSYANNSSTPKHVDQIHLCWFIISLTLCMKQVPNLLRKEAKIGDDDKGNVYATSISPPSYAKQFKQDFKLFLSSRSKELVPQGGMLLAFLGRYDASEYISIPGIIRMALNDLVSENLIEDQAKLEHFNVPLFDHAYYSNLVKNSEPLFFFLGHVFLLCTALPFFSVAEWVNIEHNLPSPSAAPLYSRNEVDLVPMIN
ncbi:hypothetical protein K1719_000531 [Acacia pycnantha]|nr:hypothetical protein K1719_000531 [Acacia pycnantha]